MIKNKMASGFILVLFFLIFTRAYASDSTWIDLGNGITARLDFIPFGTIIKASSDEETKLEAVPFVGSGFNFSLNKWKIGLASSLLFYSGGDDKVYVMAAAGIMIYFRERFAVSLGWDFGKVSRSDNAFKDRMRLFLSYNLKLR